jgi:penicillin amidase
MTIEDTTMLAALQGRRNLDDLCRAAGISEAEFEGARAAFLRRQAILSDQRITAAVGGKVEIIRDRAGVPHVYAGATLDLFFGLGVAMAQDRLWQMDRLRRRALGQQAAALGPAYLPSDIAHRTVGIPAIAAREADAMDAQTRAVVDSLVAGINRQIEAFGQALPIEFLILEDTPRPFTAADIVAIGRGIWWSLNGRIDRIMAAEAAHMIEDEALRLLYLTPEGSENLVLPSGTVSGDPLAARVAAGTDDATGSNNWALSGSRTASGAPILAGDPHQPFWVPSSWYEYGLHGPEDDAAGAGHPGFPGLWWGSTGRTAWAITNNAASTRDLFRETVDPQDPGRYREGDRFVPFEERQETIEVRGKAAHKLTVRETIRGPVVNALVPAMAADGDPPMSLRWVGREHIDDIRAGLAISRAKNWDEFRHALRDWSIAVFNFVYADRAGNIGYQMAGRVPIRGRITYGVRDAGNPKDVWRGTIPFDDLPNVLNPATGAVASANQRIVPGDYKQPIYGAYSQGHRGLRLAEAFQVMHKADVPATIELQNDVRNCRATRLVPHIIALLEGATGPAGTVRDLLAGWDGSYTLETAAPTVFETFMAEWQEIVLGQILPGRLIPLCMQQTGLATALLEDPARPFFAEGTAARVADAAGLAYRALQRRFGEDPSGWIWGRVHLAHWRHPLSGAGLGEAADIGPAPVAGGSHTIRNTGGELPPHNAGSGAEYRIVVDFAKPDSFLAVQNIGNSGIPGSPNYRDQFEPWLRGAYHTVALTRAGVQADRAVTTTITP